MATRHRHGLYDYRPRSASNLGGKGSRGGGKPRAKRPTGPSGLSKPGTYRAARQANRAGTRDTSDERRHLRNGALAETLGDAAYAGYNELLREYDREHHATRYRTASAERRAAAPKKPKPKGLWIRVKAHRRHRPKR